MWPKTYNETGDHSFFEVAVEFLYITYFLYFEALLEKYEKSREIVGLQNFLKILTPLQVRKYLTFLE